MRQATVVLEAVLAVAVLAACQGPISTMRSPYHLRSVEVRNATDKPKVLKIEPTAAQHLGAATTFTGILRPGEVKSLYLYHGFEYDFRVLEEPGFDQLTHKIVQVDKDFGLVFAGMSPAHFTREFRAAEQIDHRQIRRQAAELPAFLLPLREQAAHFAGLAPGES